MKMILLTNAMFTPAHVCIMQWGDGSAPVSHKEAVVVSFQDKDTDGGGFWYRYKKSVFLIRCTHSVSLQV